MAVTRDAFVDRYPSFSGRGDDTIRAALAAAELSYSEAVCGSQLHKQLVMARARVDLMRDTAGLPSSKTKASTLSEDAEKELRDLEKLVPVTGIAL